MTSDEHRPSGAGVVSASPDDREVDVVLRDGSTIRVRRVRADDERRLHEFLRGLSEQSRGLRLCGGVSDDLLKREARRESHADRTNGVGLVATARRDERVLAHAEFDVLAGERAEVGPKRRTPCSNSVSAGRTERRCAMAPNSVARPVRTRSAVAAPLTTCVPRSTVFVRRRSGASAGTVPEVFSAGYDSPVSAA